MDFDETWQEASPQHPLSSLCFSCRSEIQDGRPGLWLAETFFDFFSTTVELILTKLDRKQILNTLYQVCVFRADRKSKMAALASDWLKHFSTFPPQPLNGFWRNLTGSNSSKPSIKFVFFVYAPIIIVPRASRKRGTLKLIHLSVRLSQTFNLGHNVCSGRAFIFGMHDPCEKTFPMAPCHDLDVWPTSRTIICMLPRRRPQSSEFACFTPPSPNFGDISVSPCLSVCSSPCLSVNI